MWSPPLWGWMKVNVDGAVKGKPGADVVGGVLRDEFGTIIALLSKSIGVVDSNFAELTALVEGIKLFLKVSFIYYRKFDC